MIKELKIEHYKGFYDEQLIEFALPDGTNNGSGLTLIVGPNNTGKTTIVESMQFHDGKKFRDSERHPSHDPKIQITSDTGLTAIFTNLQNGARSQNQGEAHGIRFEIIPARRHWSPEFNGMNSFADMVSTSSRTNVRGTDSFNLGPTLATIAAVPAQKEKFNNLMKKLMPHFTDWAIDADHNDNDYIKYNAGGGNHRSNLLGDGVISLFRLVSHFVHTEESTFIIDEPELSLHPAGLKRLGRVISELAKSKQIIVCTHSPYLINWSDFLNGAKIIRLNKLEDKKCTVSKLDNTKDYSNFIRGSIDEYQKPQLLDTTAKEILFSDRILFLEGQQDVGLVRKWFREKDIDFDFDIFGYGVGGEANMKLFFEMSKDLGLTKIAALYDKNSESYEDDKLAFPSYLLLQHTKQDIRDKLENGVVTRTGIFNSNGSIKPENEIEFERLMSTIQAFLES